MTITNDFTTEARPFGQLKVLQLVPDGYERRWNDVAGSEPWYNARFAPTMAFSEHWRNRRAKGDFQSPNSFQRSKCWGYRKDYWHLELYPSGNPKREISRFYNRLRSYTSYPTDYYIPDYWKYRTGGSVYAIPEDVPEFAFARANTLALQRVQDRQASMGMALASSHKTAQHLVETSTLLFGVLRDIKKGRFSAVSRRLGLKPNKLADTASKRWLEHSYAITPLLGDVADAYGVWQGSLDGNLYKSGGGRVTVEHKHRQFDVTTHVSVKYYSRIVSPELGFAGQLGLLNPLEIAWDLVPFSFVVDWVVPVMSSLEALQAFVTNRFENGYVSVKSSGINYVPERVIASTNATTRIGEDNEGFRLYDRVLRNSFLPPQPYATSPFSNVGRIANALALSYSLFNRRFRR